jgi:hypothetical protein
VFLSNLFCSSTLSGRNLLAISFTILDIKVSLGTPLTYQSDFFSLSLGVSVGVSSGVSVGVPPDSPELFETCRWL